MKLDATVDSLVQKAAAVSFPDAHESVAHTRTNAWIKEKYSRGSPNDSEPSTVAGTLEAGDKIAKAVAEARDAEPALFGNNARRLFAAIKRLAGK